MIELNERQAKAIQFVAPQNRGIVALALVEKVKPAGSIKAYCLMCKQGSRQEINECADDLCPLRMNRPYQGSNNNE